LAAATGSLHRQAARRRSARERLWRIRAPVYLALLFYLFLAIFPLYWMVIATLKNDYDLIDPAVSPFWFQRPLGFNHFDYLFNRTSFFHWYGNTYLVAGSVLVITLVLCVPAGYALARLRFRGSQTLGIAIFLTYLIPPILLFLPIDQLVAGALGLQNSKWALVVVYPTFTVPFCTWLMMGFFKRIPIEIEEAAMVDGCNRWQAITRIVLPVSVPGILTAAIFAFTLSMQDFIYALVMVSPSAEKVLTIGIPTELIRVDVFYWGEIFTAALIPAVVVAALYNFFLAYFVAGITGGAINK